MEFFGKKVRIRKDVFVAVVVAIFALSFIFALKNLVNSSVYEGTYSMILPDEQVISLEIAETQDEKSLGLSFRENLEENTGMLFVYTVPGMYSFWMKDMLFSIDIIWLDENFNVINIKRDLSPDTYPTSFVSQSPAQYVLEVYAGFAKDHEIKIGERLTIQKK